MSTTEPQARATFFATTRKAFAGGIAGAATAVGGSLSTVFADGAVSGAEAWLLAGAGVGGFVVGFAAVWRVPNAQPSEGEHVA